MYIIKKHPSQIVLRTLISREIASYQTSHFLKEEFQPVKHRFERKIFESATLLIAVVWTIKTEFDEVALLKC